MTISRRSKQRRANISIARGIPKVRALSFAIAGPVTEEPIALTNRDWSFTRASLKEATGAERAIILNDFEALALSLPHLKPEDLVQIGGHPPPKPRSEDRAGTRHRARHGDARALAERRLDGIAGRIGPRHLAGRHAGGIRSARSHDLARRAV